MSSASGRGGRGGNRGGHKSRGGGSQRGPPGQPQGHGSPGTFNASDFFAQAAQGQSPGAAPMPAMPVLGFSEKEAGVFLGSRWAATSTQAADSSSGIIVHSGDSGKAGGAWGQPGGKAPESISGSEDKFVTMFNSAMTSFGQA